MGSAAGLGATALWGAMRRKRRNWENQFTKRALCKAN